MMWRMGLGSTGALVGLLSVVTVAPLVAQGAYDAQEDLRPRVIERAAGEERFLPDGIVMRLKVGPENSGSGYLFMGYDEIPPGAGIPRATVEACFQRIGRGEGETPAPETEAHLAEERRWCRMSY